MGLVRAGRDLGGVKRNLMDFLEKLGKINVLLTVEMV